jgi:hypothetical protein
MALLSTERSNDAVLRKNRKWKVTAVKVVQNKNQQTPGLLMKPPAPARKEGYQKAYFKGVWFSLKLYFPRNRQWRASLPNKFVILA